MLGKLFSVMQKRDDLPEMRLPLALVFMLSTALFSCAGAKLLTSSADGTSLAGLAASLAFVPGRRLLIRDGHTAVETIRLAAYYSHNGGCAVLFRCKFVLGGCVPLYRARDGICFRGVDDFPCDKIQTHHLGVSLLRTLPAHLRHSICRTEIFGSRGRAHVAVFRCEKRDILTVFFPRLGCGRTCMLLCRT